MNKSVVKKLCCVVAVTSAALLSALETQAQAGDRTTWNFSSRPAAWGRDTTNPQLRDVHRFNVAFSNAAPRVRFGRGGVIFTSANVPSAINRTRTVVQGGGIGNTTGFSTQDFDATCVLEGNAASRTRSQAAIYLNRIPMVNSHEVDLLEVVPARGAIFNSITWVGENRTNRANRQWGNFGMARYGLRQVGNTFTVSRTATTRGARPVNRTAAVINGFRVGQTMILHNKAWRFTDNPITAGAVAPFRCTTASRANR